MINETQQLDFYQDYLTVKRKHLITVMDRLLIRMQSERCNIRHYKQWEAEMTSFKEEYRVFRKNIVQWLNEADDLQLEAMVSPCCEEIEEHYEILAQIFLEKSDEIREKTTYFETQQQRPLVHRFLPHSFKPFNRHILTIRFKRK